MTKIISWNINSVRLRIKQVIKLLETQQPDILCLQETKVRNEEFPFKEFHKIGYDNIHVNGEKSYNGVAIISKIPLKNNNIIKISNSKDTRHISAEFDSIELHNFYIPAGGDEPDVDINPKYKFKIEFLKYMTNLFASYNANKKVVILGDFNIAPFEHDVWSSKQLRNVVSHTELEKNHLQELQKSLNWIDTARFFTPQSEKLYSWWSYRNRDWKKSNRGRRLDHIWVTPALKDDLISYSDIKEARDWERPSDHIPIIIEIDNNA